MIVDRIGIGLLAVGAGGIACMMLPETEEPEPVAAFAVAAPPSTCGSHTYEPDHDRNPDWMSGAEGRAISDVDLAIEPMRGPFLTLAHARGATSPVIGAPPFEASTIVAGAHHLELVVQVGGLWYVHRLGDAAPGVESVMQRVDLAPAPGSELIIAMTSKDPYAETRVICGVGSSGIPSCARIEVGKEGMSPRFGTHLRLDTSCDGTAVLTGWRSRPGRCGDQLRVWIRERVKLAFP